MPHLNTDPIKNSEITPLEVFKIDKGSVRKSDVLVAYVGTPSLGVGMELAYSEINNIPIILLYEEKKNDFEICERYTNSYQRNKFKNYTEALKQLKEYLECYLENMD